MSTQILNLSADKLSSAQSGSKLASLEHAGEEVSVYVRFLSKPELAAIIGKRPRSIDNMMRARLIPFLKIGRSVRFKLADVERALEAVTVKEVSRYEVQANQPTTKEV